MTDPLLDRLVRNIIALERIANTIAREADARVQELYAAIAADLQRIDPTSPPQRTYRQLRVAEFLASVRGRLREYVAAEQTALKDRLALVGRAQAKYAERTLVATLGEVAGRAVRATPMTQQRVRAILNTDPIQGRLLKEHLERIGSNAYVRVRDQIRIGMLNEEGIPDIVRRIRGRQAGVIRQDPVTGAFVSRGTRGAVVRPRFVGGVLSSTTRETEALVRTAVTHVSNEGLRATYQENARILSGLRFAAFLDDRTCFAAGTLVLTPGGHRPIEEIRAGDLVVGGSRRPRRVLGTKRASKSEMVAVRLSNGAEVTCTADHLWLSATRGWVRADSLRPHESMAYNLNVRDLSWHEKDVRDLREPLRSAARKVESLLWGALLPPSSIGGRVQGHSGPEGALRDMRPAPRADAVQEARRQPGGSPFLFPGLLPRGARQTSRVDLSWMREARIADGVGGKESEVLLAGLPYRLPQAGPQDVPDLRRALHADSGAMRRRGLQGRPDPLLGGMLLPVGDGRRGEEAEDQPGVHGRQAPELDGRAVCCERPRSPRSRVELGGGAGPEEGRIPLPRVRRDGGGERAEARRPPPRAVRQLCDGEGGESSVESGLSVQVLSHARGVGDGLEAGDAAPQDRVAVTVLSVRPFVAQATVYDIQVEHDHSFIVGGVVVHNSEICLSLDGTTWPLDSPEIVLPGRDTHYGCRSVLVPEVNWEKVGLDAPDEGTRAVRDLSDVSEDDLARKVSARRRTGDLGSIRQVPSSVRAEEWLRGQPVKVQDKLLGRGKAELFRAGKITLTDLVRQDLSVVSLRDLEAA